MIEGPKEIAKSSARGVPAAYIFMFRRFTLEFEGTLGRPASFDGP